MESLVTSREDIIRQSKDLIIKLMDYIKTLEKDAVLEDVVNTPDVKNSTMFVETAAYKEPKKKKESNPIANIGTNNYKDYYDADSMPEIKF